MSQKKFSCGWDVCIAPDINSTLSTAAASGYDFVACPIIHPRYKREFLQGKAKDRDGPFTRSDMLLCGADWSQVIVAKLSPYLEPDSNVKDLQLNSIKAVEQELLYYSHLNVPAILVQLKGTNCINLARLVHNRILANHVCSQIWVHVPMQAPSDLAEHWQCATGDTESEDGGTLGESAFDSFKEDTWHWWNTFRTICNFERKINCAIELSADIPTDSVVRRWLGEPVKCIIVPTNLFLTNKKGFPVLSRAHQMLIRRFYKLDSQMRGKTKRSKSNLKVMITGANKHAHVKLYHQYLEHMWKTQPQSDSVDQFAKGFEDYLQCPLQPLMDNLESYTYETFEKDPVKYTAYQKAVYLAILDKVSFGDKDSTVLRVAVVGAGRGPLVRACFSAAQKADRRIKVYAIEKNPNAIVTLLHQRDEFWGDSVSIVSSDMRDWNPDELMDVMVSELLGSFGDNELSPECLDGAQKCLKPDGISIPTSYTSYMNPIQSSKLYNEVRAGKRSDKAPEFIYENPYVVRMHNKTELSPAQPVFTFTHPKPAGAGDNTRYKSLTFNIQEDCVLHGFAGYFDTVLYREVTLSIVPATHSEGMFSWFSMFFPLKDPIYLPSGCQVEAHIWRCVSPRFVWYEWCVKRPQITTIHNPNGRSYKIGL